MKLFGRASYARLEEEVAEGIQQQQPQGGYIHHFVSPMVVQAADWHRRNIWDGGIVCVALAAMIFSISALCVKLIHSRVPVLEITLYRSSISWLLSWVIARSSGVAPIFGQRQNLFKLLCRGVFGASAMTSYYVALQTLPLADAVTIFFLNPPLTALLAWLTRGEPLSWIGTGGCLASFLGVVLLAHPPFLFGGHADWGTARVGGTVAGLVSAICCAAAFISIRYIGKGEPALVVAMWFHTATLVMSSIPLAAGWPARAVWPSLGDTALLVCIALTSFSAQLYLTRGFQTASSATKASATNFLQVVYSYAWGALLLNERITMLGIMGSLLTAVGVVTVNQGQKPKQAEALELGHISGVPDLHQAGALKHAEEERQQALARQGTIDGGDAEEAGIAVELQVMHADSSNAEAECGASSRTSSSIVACRPESPAARHSICMA